MDDSVTETTPKRICMMTNLYPPVVSGSSTQSFTLARELAARGAEPFVITARVDPSTPEYEETDGVAVYRLPCLKLPELPIALNCPWLSVTFTPGNISRIRRILRRRRPEVLHLHNHMFDLAFSAVLMRREFRVPLVITLHTVIRHAKAMYNALLYPADRIVLRCLVTRYAETLICPDINMRQYARQAFPTSRTELVPYGIELPHQADPARVEELRRELNLQGKRVILSLGNIHEVRSRRDEIRALPAILKAHPDAVLLIVGGENTPTPRRLAKELDVEHAVVFAGHRPHEDVPALLAMAEMEAHLFYQEQSAATTSLGIASQEAMAAGKVVLSAANPDSLGPGELRRGENVFLVDFHQPDRIAEIVIDVLNDPAKRARVGEAAGRLIRERFAWDPVCRRTLGVYAEAQRRNRG
ncbi:MAG: glycosyltransferase family 4 protein [Phycisphaerae bacterium]|nr:glycosyltransferase family 4 protein [Phycisphaerae bacterium]